MIERMQRMDRMKAAFVGEKRSRFVGLATSALAALAIGAGGAAGQDIADIDYQYLSFRALGVEFGYVWPTTVEPAESYTVRFDMGYAGPGLRVTPTLTWWRSRLEDSQITEFEERVLDLIQEQNGGARPLLDLGTVQYTDIVVGLDAHVVWRLPLDVLTFGGIGLSAHIIDGSGTEIDETFVEDLIDSVDPGFNLHVGTEIPLSERLRLYGTGRYEVTPDLQYFQIRGGLQFMFGPNAPGERRN